MSVSVLVEAFVFILLMLCSSRSAKTLQKPFDVLNDVGEDPKLEHYNTSLENQTFPSCNFYVTSNEFTILANGSLFLTDQNSTIDDGFYLRNGTAIFCGKEFVEGLNATTLNVSETASARFSEEFKRCGHVLLEPEEYILFENDTIYIEIYSKWYDPMDYFIVDVGVYVCAPSFQELKAENVTSDSLNMSETEIADTHNFSDEFQRCGHILIESDEFKLFENRTIYIEIYSKSYGPSDYLIVDKNVYICVPSYEELKQNGTIPYDWAKFSKTSDIVTFVGLLVSIVSLMSHLTIFLLVPTVRNLPGFCLASLSLSLLMAYICFLVAFLLESEELCAGLGMTVYYFFLTSFFWMNAIAFDVWRSFRVVMRELRITSDKLPWRRFLLYSAYCWAIPALLTVLVKVFDTTSILPEDLRPSFGQPFCWFGQRKALLLFFAVPLIIVMILNIAFFADVVFVINRATIKSGSAQDANLRRSFAMFTRLALIMGLTWVFGIAAGFADKPFLWYIFIVLNTLQGLFIFAVFLGSSKVRNMFTKQYRSRKRSSTSVRTVSAAL